MVRTPRFRFRSLMGLVVVLALGMTALIELARVEGDEFLTDAVPILAPYLIMFLIKLGFDADARWRRLGRGGNRIGRGADIPLAPSSSEVSRSN